MAKPVLFVQNFFNEIAFPDHTISANEAATGAEAWRVGTGRRSALNRWTPTTENAAAWIRVQCDQARAADMIAIDRGHNLSGEVVTLERSADAVTWTTVFSLTVPSAEGGTLDASPGALTEEGAWLYRFTEATDTYWRLTVSAMGAGLRPEIRGLYLGKAYELGEYLDEVYEDESDDLVTEEVQTDAGWRGAGRIARVKSGELALKLSSAAEYETVRTHVLDQFGERRPMWIVHDPDDADLAVLGIRPPGRLGFVLREDWEFRQGTISWVEHEPRVR